MIKTRVALATHGDNQFCGHSVLTDLAGKTSVAKAIALACGAPAMSAEDVAVLDDVLTCSLAADPRIWPVKVSRLLSSYGGTLAGYGGAHLSLEGARVSPWPTGDCAQLLADLAREVGDAGTAADVDRVVDARVASRSIFAGYGVVFREEDERMVALEACLRARGRETRRYWRLMRMVETALLRHKKLPANAGAGVAAACMDCGMTPHQTAVFATACASVCFLANAVEGAQNPAPELQRMPVRYIGHVPRVTPRGG